MKKRTGQTSFPLIGSTNPDDERVFIEFIRKETPVESLEFRRYEEIENILKFNLLKIYL